MRARSVQAGVLITTLALSATAVRFLSGGGGGPQHPPSGVTRSIVDITIQSTAAGATLRLLPGIVASVTVVSKTGEVTVSGRSAADGVDLGGPTGNADVRVRAVYYEPSGSELIRVSLSQRGPGKTSLSIIGEQSSASRPIALRLDHSGRTVTSASRETVFGPHEAPLPGADPRHLVLASYYPWFTPANAADPTRADRPAVPEDVFNFDQVLAATRLARGHGIDGFVVSWAGDTDQYPFDLATRAAELTGSYVVPLVETGKAYAGSDGARPADPSPVLRYLTQVLTRSASPAFLRVGGRPAVFVYDMQRLPPAAWRLITARLAAAGTPVVIIGDGGYPDYTDVSDGWNLFDPNPMSGTELDAQLQFAATVLRARAAVEPGGAPKIFVAAVSPGHDDRRIHGAAGWVTPRGQEGSRYALTWSAALRAHPDIVLVNSWNEWFEDTAVEPGVANGDLALTQTGAFAARFKSTPARP